MISNYESLLKSSSLLTSPLVVVVHTPMMTPKIMTVQETKEYHLKRLERLCLESKMKLEDSNQQ